jgi:hypothetical protein
MERKNIFKQNEMGHLKKKIERAGNFKYLGVIPNEDNNHQKGLKERIKNANKSYFMLQKCFLNKNIYNKTKIDTTEHNNRQNVNICIRNLDANKER